MHSKMLSSGETPQRVETTGTNYRKALILVTGLQMIGKTALSTRVGAAIGMQVFDSDTVKAELYGEEGQRIGTPERERELMANTYDEINRRARAVLDSGAPVIIAGTQSNQINYDLARQRADAAGVPLIVVRFDLDKITDLEGFLRSRLRSRLEKNDAGPTNIVNEEGFGLVRETFGRFKKLNLEKVDYVITLDPNAPLDELVAKVISDLSAILVVPLVRK